VKALIPFLLLLLSSCAFLYRETNFLTDTSLKLIHGKCGVKRKQNTIIYENAGITFEIHAYSFSDLSWVGPVILPIYPFRDNPVSTKVSAIYSPDLVNYQDNDFRSWKLKIEEKLYEPSNIQHFDHIERDQGGALKKTRTVVLEFPTRDQAKEGFSLIVTLPKNDGFRNMSFEFAPETQWHYSAILPIHKSTCVSK